MIIPDAEVWAAAGSLVLITAGFAFTTQRSLGKMMTRKEHEGICGEKNAQIAQALEKISVTLDRHIRDTREHRDIVANSLHSIGLKIAVIETRMEMKK